MAKLPVRPHLGIITAIVFVLAAGCRSGTATGPAATVATATPGGVPAAVTAQPSPTARRPTATATITASPTGPPTAVPSLTPSATATIEDMIGPDFAAGVNPLTGLAVADPVLLARRPIAIKVSNYPPIVRPQAGLNNADLVFEHYAEGGVTRFTAIYYSQDADLVGSIRSARLIDFEIPQMYDAALAYSGSSGPLQERFRASSFFKRIISPDFGHGGFFRQELPDRAFEHTLFTGTRTLRYLLEQREENRPPVLNGAMLFRAEPLAAGSPARNVQIGYSGTSAFWQYNQVDGRYRRWTDGEPHLDGPTGNQLGFKNIIVIAAHHQETDILEDLVGGGHYSIEIQLWGEGPVSLFRDGQRFDGRWRRENPEQMVTFYDADGRPLPLAPGNSFIQLVPLGFTGLNVTE